MLSETSASMVSTCLFTLILVIVVFLLTFDKNNIIRNIFVFGGMSFVLVLLMLNSIRIGMPVDIKTTPVDAIVKEVEMNDYNSENLEKYKTVLSCSGNIYNLYDVETYEKCNGKKGCKIKANLEKYIYLDGDVKYIMKVN